MTIAGGMIRNGFEQEKTEGTEAPFSPLPSVPTSPNGQFPETPLPQESDLS